MSHFPTLWARQQQARRHRTRQCFLLQAPHAPMPLGTKVLHACMDEGNKAAGGFVVAETGKLAKGGQHAQVVEEDVEERVAQATASFEKELQVFKDEAQDGDLVGLGEHLLTYFGKAVGALDSQERQVGRADISSLSVQDRSLAETRFCKCSAVGQVLVSTLEPILAALPFGAPVGAVIGVIFARAAQAAHNATAAQRLLRYIKVVDLRLAKLLVAKQRGRLEALSTHIHRLGKKLDVAARLMFAYSGRGFLIRSLLSSSDKDNFAKIEDEIRQIMNDITVDHMLDRMDAAGDESLPHGDSVLKELCKLAGEPHEGTWDEARVERLLAKLQRGNPQALKGVLKASARLEDKIIASELSALEGRVTKLEATTNEHGKQIVELSNTVTWLMYKVAAAYDKCQGPISLKTYLRVWWDTAFEEERLEAGSDIITVPCKGFLEKLNTWICKNMGEEGQRKLQMFDNVLKKIVSNSGLSLVALEGCGNAFLDHVFARELDENADGLVTQDELLSVQIKAEQYAKLKFEDKAKWTLNNWLELLNSIFMGFDRDSLILIASEKLMHDLEQRLQVKGIIQSYKISTLAAQYVEGTRQWLYNDINKWLDVATARVSDD